MESIQIFTTPILDGYEITEYHGLVTARSVRAMNVFRDIMTQFRDLFGGRSESYENIMDELQLDALHELEIRTRDKGANAVVGLLIDFDNIGSKGNSLLMAFAKGTAVTIRKK
ncbi:MAG: YbjQ family protein [Candidatus Kapabacteria bacterium]|jgi:uncharacterized protein YbjQ (UPF0145 family)|nr:YbjQ family protein [Candidatus Kapabacteria bacterium]